jgi:hypothetical protein
MLSAIEVQRFNLISAGWQQQRSRQNICYMAQLQFTVYLFNPLFTQMI